MGAHPDWRLLIQEGVTHMDWQTAFNALIALVALLITAGLKSILDSVTELRREDADLHERVTALAMALPETYARRDDMREIRDTLVRIEAKLDNKVDK
jgi:hypothetical protein